MPDEETDLLTADADEAASALGDRLGQAVIDLNDVLTSTLRTGDRDGVVLYVRLFDEIVEKLREALGEAVAREQDREAPLAEPAWDKDDREASLAERPAWVDALVLQAPFSVWTEHYGRGLGSALAIFAELRAHSVEAAPLVPPPARDPPPERTDSEQARHFLWLVAGQLERAAAEPPLRRIARSFELSVTDLASLFGVRRQAVGQWLETGVPPARAPKLNQLARLADILERNLKPERIPGVVRTPAEAYGGLTMLQMIEQGREDEVLARVEASFDWSQAA